MPRPSSARPLVAVTALVLAACTLPAPAAAVPFYTDGSWGPRVPVPFDPFLTSSETILVSNHSGGAFALGYQYVTGSANLHASFYSFGRGWGDDMLVNATGINGWTTPTGALAGDGSAVAGWVLSPAGNASIGASVFTPAAGWSPAATLSQPPNEVSWPSVAVAEGGTAAAAWSENVSGTYQIHARIYTPGSGWSTAALVDPANPNGGALPSVQAGPGGSFLLAWAASDGNLTAVRFARYTPGSGWSAPTNVSAAPAGQASLFSVVSAAPDGTFFVAWLETDYAFSQNVSARRYTPAGGFEPIHALSSSGLAFTRASVALDPGGNATFAWIEGDLNGSAVMAARYEAGSGWEPAARVGYTDLDYRNPAVTGGENGTATAVWHHLDSHGNGAAYARFVPGRGWGVAASISDTPDAGDAHLALMPGDRALLVLDYATSESFLFTPFDTTPPPLSVTGPADGAIVTQSTVVVTGATELGARVLVNGVAAAVAAGGSWSVRVSLGPGANTLSVQASDAAGNTASSNRTVTFDDPVPDLVADLALAQANLSAAEAQLAGAQAELLAAQANLSVSQNQLAALQASANASLAEQHQLELEINTLNHSLAHVGATPQPAADSLALLVALVGVALGAGAIVVGLMARRSRGREEPKE